MSEPTRAKPVTTSLLGAAAEYCVMCQLLRRGQLAALAPAGMPFADILVCNQQGSALSAIQVKARTYGSDGGWHMKRKHEDWREALCVYLFVDLRSDPRNPATMLGRPERRGRGCAWRQLPGVASQARKGGKAHAENDMRRLRPDYSDIGLSNYGPGWLDQYKERWETIAASAAMQV